MDDFHGTPLVSDDFETQHNTPASDVAAAEHPLASHYRALMRGAGEDVSREGLIGTPQRAAKAFEFLTKGYREDITALLNGAIFQSANKDMVIVRDIEFYSLCEHHILPFYGKAHVAYLPKGKVIGLSKIPRIVDVFARRLQIQENLTEQIGQCVQSVTGAEGVAVVVEARHLCMLMRGVEKQNASMVTSSMRGLFRENENVRNQFLRFLPNTVA